MLTPLIANVRKHLGAVQCLAAKHPVKNFEPATQGIMRDLMLQQQDGDNVVDVSPITKMQGSP